jgi:hypothetical protein
MKLTESIRVHLDDATAEAFRQRARRAGCQPGELLRDIICLQEWGRTWGEHVAHHRRRTLGQEGSIEGDREVTSPDSWPTSSGTDEIPQVLRPRAVGQR